MKFVRPLLISLIATTCSVALAASIFRPSKLVLNNSTYTFNLEHTGILARLLNGEFSQPDTPLAGYLGWGYVKVQGNVQFIGDLNGDGLDDAVVGFKITGSNPSYSQVLLNDGHRLVQAGSVLNDNSNNRIRIINTPSLDVDVYKIENNKLSLASDPTSFWGRFSEAAEREWIADKSMFVNLSRDRPQENKFFSDKQHSKWAFPAHLKKPVVIVFNGPATYIQESSGDPIIDSIAYGSIATLVRETPPAQEFAQAYQAPGAGPREPSLFNQRTQIQCTILDDTVKCKLISKYEPIPLDLKDLVVGQKIDSPFDKAATQKLIQLAMNNSYDFIQSRLQFKDSKDVNAPESTFLKKFLVADLDKDGQPDLVVQVTLDDRKKKNAIIVLLNEKGELRQHRLYYRVPGPLDSLNVIGNRIVAKWNSTAGSYASVLRISKHPAPEDALDSLIHHRHAGSS